MSALPLIRPVTDGDGPSIAALIAACFAEYEGCLYEPAEFPELAAPATWAAGRGTRLWVAGASEASGDIVGCIAASPHADGVELHKFYVAQPHRGAGLALALFGHVLNTAREWRAPDLLLWTDTRFARAHAFYRREGFRFVPAVRALGDVSNSFEYLFVRPDRCAP
jgi:putative acetyltransferase